MLVLVSMNLFSQGFPLQYKSWNFEVGADCQLGLGKVVTGFSVNELRLRSTLTLTKGFQVVTVFKTTKVFGNWYDLSTRNNRISQFYAQYSNSFKVLKRNLVINMYAGRLEYYPNYNDPRFYYDNIGLFDKPPAYYGAALKAYYVIFKKSNLDSYIDVNSGDLLGNSGYKAMLNEIYVSYTPKINKDIYGHGKIGKYPGSQFLINEAYISFEHKFKSITPFAEAGRLPGYDLSPFGVRIGAKYSNKYFTIGLYYENRLGIFNFNEMHYFSVFLSVLKPKLLASILSNGAILYEPGSRSIKFRIPIVNLKF
jgi:hypothetical protein